jgi:ATPase family associated with various cellular activities (AAA)
MFDFDDLALHRRTVKEFCNYHASSLLTFHSGCSFLLTLDERFTDNNLHHLTTTGTCIESLIGPIYCRCRALPLVVSYLREFDQRLIKHLAQIFDQLKISNRFAIGEPSFVDPAKSYPPNAFHTYWTLELLERLKRFASHNSFHKLSKDFDFERRRQEMILWARSCLGIQVALHEGKSSVLDSDQLAWSLAILVKFGDNLQSNLAEQDLIRQALKCLFETQEKVGTWRTYQPLFHYRDTGNAYCYVYETFTILLKAFLTERLEGEFLRLVLRPFFPKLVALWQYAKATQIALAQDDGKIGWCSGHRINQPQPESWATASVFSYAQALRRLIGIWAREEAFNSLTPIRISATSIQDAEADLVQRGDTWNHDGISVSERLYTMFINPVRMAGRAETLEPDNPCVAKNQARGAILFGPPGTSKTTLARAVAGAIGWNYVELHASHFVADGLPNVQRTADALFKKLMELDRTVVLFDEIDDLVREREREPDSFGRFLTNSMLPKLAQLWKQRKIIYFVATNHISYFDRAIIRSERFDALILVSPPSFAAKVKQLTSLLGSTSNGEREIQIEFSKAAIEKAFAEIKCPRNEKEGNNALPSKHVLAKFLLMRWDQLDELSQILTEPKAKGPLTISNATLKTALGKIKDARLCSRQTYCDYRVDAENGSKDFSKIIVWETNGLSDQANFPTFVKKSDTRYWIVTKTEDVNRLSIPGYRLSHKEPGKINCEPPQRKQARSKRARSR